MVRIEVNQIRWNTITRAENRDFASATLTNRMTEWMQTSIYFTLYSHFISMYKFFNGIFDFHFILLLNSQIQCKVSRVSQKQVGTCRIRRVLIVALFPSLCVFSAFNAPFSGIIHESLVYGRKKKLPISQWCAQFKERPHSRYIHIVNFFTVLLLNENCDRNAKQTKRKWRTFHRSPFSLERGRWRGRAGVCKRKYFYAISIGFDRCKWKWCDFYFSISLSLFLSKLSRDFSIHIISSSTAFQSLWVFAQ